MRLPQKLRCRLGRHQILCARQVIMKEDDTAVLTHAHLCLSCNIERTYEDEPLEEEFAQALKSLINPPPNTAMVYDDPKPFIH